MRAPPRPNGGRDARQTMASLSRQSAPSGDEATKPSLHTRSPSENARCDRRGPPSPPSVTGIERAGRRPAPPLTRREVSQPCMAHARRGRTRRSSMPGALRSAGTGGDAEAREKGGAGSAGSHAKAVSCGAQRGGVYNPAWPPRRRWPRAEGHRRSSSRRAQQTTDALCARTNSRVVAATRRECRWALPAGAVQPDFGHPRGVGQPDKGGASVSCRWLRWAKFTRQSQAIGFDNAQRFAARCTHFTPCRSPTSRHATRRRVADETRANAPCTPSGRKARQSRRRAESPVARAEKFAVRVKPSG